MNIFAHFRNIIFNDIEFIYPNIIRSDDVKIEFPNNPEYGDLSSNISMILAKKTNANPKEIAEKISDAISKNEYVDEVTIAGAGFLNMKVKKSFWYLFLKQLIRSGYDYPKINIGNEEKVNIEFVSANPTGPLHLGHAKGAVFGDVIANLLSKCGYDVTKEFYINDAGNQINNLTKSLKIRYKQLLGEKIELDENCYPGEYLIELAKNLHEEFGDDINKINDENFLNNLATEKILKIIKNDLHRLGVYHDNFVSEKQLILQNKVGHCIDFLKEKNLLYQGMLEKPKGESSDDWEPKEQTLFRSTNYGDDIDRAVVKSDGQYTYFASDIAYHLDKIERGFNNMVLLLGADHIGYKKRLVSSVDALSDGKAKLDVKICQLVKLLRDGKPIKMSKRSGNFISLEEILDEIGKDALRFAILSKNSDTVLEIDVEKLKQQTKDNPVFYVQYASARANSILKRAKEMGIEIENAIENEIDLSFLDSEYDFNLIKMLALYPKILTSCLNTLDPHKITYYLYDLACKFHQIWSKGTKEENIKFIIEDNVELTKARVSLVYAVVLVLRSGLKILGIKAVKQM
jgi:arginyl-tRNA synthetase